MDLLSKHLELAWTTGYFRLFLVGFDLLSVLQ